MDEGFKVKMERWKQLGEIFLKNNIKAFIKDIDGNFYFADMILVGDDTLTFQCFDPEHRRGKKFRLYWPLIVEFEEYKEEVKA